MSRVKMPTKSEIFIVGVLTIGLVYVFFFEPESDPRPRVQYWDSAGIQQNGESQPAGSNNTSSTTSLEWWEVEGTLHNASALEWQNATYANKLATCGDLMCNLYYDEMLSDRISSDFESMDMDKIRFWADSLVIVLNIAMERLPDEEENQIVYANQNVAELATLTLMMSNWLK